MRMVKKNQKRLLVVSVALFIICGVALGYAALSSAFKISGTGTISSNWDILFTRIEEASKKGATANESVITDKLTATFDVNIEAPGNFIEYNVTLKNNGNIDAVIESIGGIVEANSEDPTGIQFKVSGIRIGDDLLAGDEKIFTVRAEIPGGETTLPSGTKTLDLKVNVRQKDIDSSGLVTTFKDCFQTNEAGDTIIKYLCGKDNTNGYSEILDVNIPKEINGHIITTIGADAFNQRGLTGVTIPNTVVRIGRGAFYNNRLTVLELPSSVTTIEYQAFFANQLKQLHFSNSIKLIGDHAFADNQLTEVEIPSSVTSLGISAFRLNLLPDEEAFIYNRSSDGSEDKTSLNSYAGVNRDYVIIPDQVTTIGEAAFYNAKCQSVVFPDGLHMIARDAFKNNLLTRIEFPSTLNSLQQSSFEENQLTQIEFRGGVPINLGTTLLKNNPGLRANTIKVPMGMLEQYKSAQGKIGNADFSSSQTWFGSDDENLLEAFYE